MDDQEIEVKMREFGFTDKEIQFFHKYKELDSKETLTFQLKGLRRVLYGMPIVYLVHTGIWFNIFLTKSHTEFIVFSVIMLFIAAVIYVMTPFKLALKCTRFLNKYKMTPGVIRRTI